MAREVCLIFEKRMLCDFCFCRLILSFGTFVLFTLEAEEAERLSGWEGMQVEKVECLEDLKFLPQLDLFLSIHKNVKC